ncbi:hypothetical protein FHS61_000257 [Altererythrobacter atlanticus]|uniref:Uncharacterized protein n=1 Tax=Croceibacterium atlanticum TaxID=1267766 RepID=A0A0F7KTD1_9SPHN|nr:DUF3297 family protein [Croceibacterium atlanticum]AKH42487.1 hypothetical protein WYH_01446 [Croceibacterium atlanticum]MBB5731264.1 hypothetical protein [Croceibacterium atlanticum]
MSDEQNPAEPETAATGADVPPDHLAIDPRSKHFNGELLRRGIGIRFKGTVRSNVEEYCISEGWVRVQAGKTMDRHGRPLTIKLNGPVEAWFEDLGEDAPVARKD